MLRPSDRPRSTLLLLVLASVTAITLDVRGGGVIASVRSAATDLAAPVRSAGEAVLGPVGDGLAGVTGYGDVVEENERLRARVEELEGERLLADDARSELAALLEANDLTHFTALLTVAARVVGAPPSSFERTLQLDRGSDDGVAEDLPVVTGAGLVGRVVDVSRTRSTVRLVTDQTSAVGSRLSRSGELAVAEGRGADRPLRLGLLDARSQVEAGDLLVTSGVVGSPFPGGIPLGRVVAVARTPGALEPEVDVVPTVDLDHLRHVRVLRTGDR
jgi:rod shape-determining protein MreC